MVFSLPLWIFEIFRSIFPSYPGILPGAAHVPIFFRRTVSGESEDIGLVLHHLVDERRNIPVVPPRHGSHDGYVDSGAAEKRDGGHGGIVGAGLLADAVVGFSEPVQGKLVFLQPYSFNRRQTSAVR